MTGSIGGFNISDDYDPNLDPDDGAFPEPEDTSFNIDEFERAASQSSGAASPSQSSSSKKKIPYHARHTDVPPNKYIGAYEEAQKWRDALLNDERNVVGGSAAFYSGYDIELTDSAKKVVQRLERLMEKFASEEDDKPKKKKKLPKPSNAIEEYIPQGKAPTSPTPTLSSSGSGSGIPPSQPPAPPDDYSDYPSGDYPEDPDKKSDIINQISDVPSDKQIKQNEERNLANAKKQFKDFIREEKDKFAREFRDEKLSLNREVQKLNAEAVARKTEINRASSDAKTAIYSLSAGVGLPGYIVASVADALVIQPAVREDVQAEQQYQRDLRDYKNESIDILNAKKDAFREYTKSQEFSNLPDDVKAQYAETGEIPEGAIPSFEEWADKTGASAAFNKPLTAPTQPGPGKAGAITSMLGKAGPIATAVVEGINLVNSNTHRLGNEARDNISSSLSKQAIPALSDKVQSFSRMSDPLQLIGMESPTHAMFQEAVETFESSVKEFEGFAREDLGFAPGALAANVEGSIMRLEQSMRIAEQTDPQKEAMIRVTDEIGLVWNEFRAMFFTAFAPIVVAVLTVIKVVLQAILDTVNFIKNLIIKLLDIVVTIMEYLSMIIPGLALHAHVARQILNELKKSKATPSGLKQMLDDFHNPNNQPVKPPKPGNFR